MVTTLAGPEIIVARSWVPEEIAHQMRTFNPRTHLGLLIRDALRYLPAEAAAELVEAITRVVVVESQLDLRIFWGPQSRHPGLVEPLGCVGRRVVTDVGVGYIVDAFQNSVELENQKYHGIGTGATAEAAGETALVTELTTEYTGDVRATGTTTEGATANIYKSVATNTLDGTPGAALREHGIFSAASAGVLLDRTLYAAITLSSGDGLESTYQLTLTAGG